MNNKKNNMDNILAVGTSIWMIQSNVPRTGKIVEVRVGLNVVDGEEVSKVTYFVRTGYSTIGEYNADEVFDTKTKFINWFKKRISDIESSNK